MESPTQASAKDNSRRHRVPMACKKCRGRHVKCLYAEGSSQRCERCTKFNLPCVFEPVPGPGGVPQHHRIGTTQPPVYNGHRDYSTSPNGVSHFGGVNNASRPRNYTHTLPLSDPLNNPNLPHNHRHSAPVSLTSLARVQGRQGLPSLNPTNAEPSQKRWSSNPVEWDHHPYLCRCGRGAYCQCDITRWSRF